MLENRLELNMKFKEHAKMPFLEIPHSS